MPTPCRKSGYSDASMSHPLNIMIASLDSSELVRLLISTKTIGESRKGDRPLRNDQNVCLYFTEEQFSFLMHIAEQCADGEDNSLTEEAVLRALVRLLQQMKVDMTGVKTEDEMLQRLEDALETEIVIELSETERNTYPPSQLQV
jgi:hypothetical protein